MGSRVSESVELTDARPRQAGATKAGKARIKLCYVISDLGYGGAQKQLFELLQHLEPDTYEPVIVNLHVALTTARFRDLGARVIGLDYKGGWNLGKVVRLASILRRERPDVVHCILTSANFYGLLAATLTRTGARVASERSLGNRFRGLRRLVYPWVLSLADVIVTNSDRNRIWLESACSLAAGKIRLIPNGCSVAVQPDSQAAGVRRAELGLAPDDFVVATVTHLTPEKNVSCLVDAAAHLRSRGERMKFLIVGEGPLEKDLRKQIDRSDLAGDVLLLGYRSHAEALLMTLLSDCFVLSSVYEGMPNALMEAMSLARACVATDVGGVSELLEHEQSGLLVQAGDAPRLADALLRLKCDAALRRRLGACARHRIEDEFSVAPMVRSYQDLYMALSRTGGLRAQ